MGIPTLLFTCTWGPDRPERATLPFVAANVAATTGLSAVVLCSADAVRLCLRDAAGSVIAPDLPPLGVIVAELLAGGGQVWVCATSAGPRGISELDLLPGTHLVGAARVVEELAAGARPIALS